MKTTVHTLAITAALIATPAAAADLYGRAPGPAYAAAPFNGYNWNGAYVGVNLGYQWGQVTNWGSAKPNGLMGGGQVGYNWQFGQVVVGAEADLQGSGANDTFAAYKFSNPWFGTVRGRTGYAMNNVLIYATGGLAYGGGRVDLGAFNETQTHLGWTLGAGVEVGLTPNWSAKAEYQYYNFGNTTVTAGPADTIGARFRNDEHTAKVGVNYRFGWGGPGPSRY